MTRGAVTAGRPGAMLVHPVAIAAVVALLLNDHVLKAAVPGALTGKLSDVAGLAFFPLLLAELVAIVVRRDPRRLVPAMSALTAVAFIVVKLTPAGAGAFAWGVGAAQGLVALAISGHVALRPVLIVSDPTDLIALPAVLVAVAVSRRVAVASGQLEPGPRGARHASAATLARRLGPAVMAGLMGAATIATSPAAPPPTGAVLSEDVANESAVRHVIWSVGKPENPFGRLRLEASTRAPGSAPEATAATIPLSVGPDFDSRTSIRIIPDDPALVPMIRRDGSTSFSTVTLDLTSACKSGCSGGARIVAERTPRQLVTRLTTGYSGDDRLLSLKGDGEGDYTGPRRAADSETLVTQMELDHVRQSANGSVTIHVAAAALADPISNVRVILRTGVRQVDDKAGLGADGNLYVGSSATPVDLGMDFSWQDIDVTGQCTAAKSCDIPVAFDVKAGAPRVPFLPAGQSPGPTPTPGQGVDVYWWNALVEVQWFDGRQVSADQVSVTSAAP